MHLRPIEGGLLQSIPYPVRPESLPAKPHRPPKLGLKPGLGAVPTRKALTTPVR